LPQSPQVPSTGMNPHIEEPRVKASSWRSQNNITGQRKIHPGADRRTTHCRDRRHGRIGQSQKASICLFQGRSSEPPAQNTGRAAVRTIAPASSLSARSTPLARSLLRRAERAFRWSGSSNCRVATPLATLTCTRSVDFTVTSIRLDRPCAHQLVGGDKRGHQ
jgi:hypothetical protein